MPMSSPQMIRIFGFPLGIVGSNFSYGPFPAKINIEGWPTKRQSRCP